MTNEYIEALSQNKTEREWVDFAERKAVAAGFKSFEANRKYKPGDKVYFINRRKNFAAFIVGKNPEYNILGAHIDSPRIDIKQAKKKISANNAHYWKGKVPPGAISNKGREFTEEHRRKLSEAHKGLPTSARSHTNKGMTWKLIDGKRVYSKGM